MVRELWMAKFFEHIARPPGRNGLPSAGDSLDNGRDFLRGKQGGSRVGQHHPRSRSVAPLKHLLHDGGAGCRAVRVKIAEPARFQVEISRRPFPRGDSRALDFSNRGRCRQAHFVQTILAGHYQCVRRAKAGKGTGHAIEQVRPTDADKLVARACRVCQRAETIEQSRHAEAAADRREMPQRGMELRRKAKSKSRPIETAAGVVGIAFDRHTECGENVGAAAAAGDGTIAVLDDRNAGSRYHERRRRADVKCPRTVATGAAGVEDVRSAGIPANHVITQHLSGRGNLRGRFPFHAERDKKCRCLRLAATPRDQFLHYRAHSLVRQIPAVDQCTQYLAEKSLAVHAEWTFRDKLLSVSPLFSIRTAAEFFKTSLFFCTDV